MKALSEIVSSGGLCDAHNHPEGLEGVFCESRARIHCCMNYATHTVNPNPESVDPLRYACLLQFAVDRGAIGCKTYYRQWVQQAGTIWIVRVLVHVVNPSHLYKARFAGWCRIHRSAYDRLANHNSRYFRCASNADTATDIIDAVQ
jgi:hypothetical protein